MEGCILEKEAYAGTYSISAKRQCVVGVILSKTLASVLPEPWNKFRIIAVCNNIIYSIFCPFDEYA